MRSRRIGTLREASLHAQLKDWLVSPGDLIETEAKGFVIDVIRGGQLIEVQTGKFYQLRPKLEKLLGLYRTHIVYPVAQDRRILRIGNTGDEVSRRNSPKHGKVEELFSELIYIYPFALHENFSLEVLMIWDEMVWVDDGKGSWRRKGWSVADHRLLDVRTSHLFTAPADYQKLLPPDLVGDFSVSDLARRLSLPERLAGKMVYCLRQMGMLSQVGKRGRAYLYSPCNTGC